MQGYLATCHLATELETLKANYVTVLEFGILVANNSVKTGKGLHCRRFVCLKSESSRL